MTILDLPTKKQKLWADFYYVVSTRMSHWRHGAAEGAEFQITEKSWWLKTNLKFCALCCFNVTSELATFLQGRKKMFSKNCSCMS